MGKKSKRRQNKGGKTKNSGKNQRTPKPNNDIRNQNINSNSNNIEWENDFLNVDSGPGCPQYDTCRARQALRDTMNKLLAEETGWHEVEDGRIRYRRISLGGRVYFIVHNTVLNRARLLDAEEESMHEKKLMELAKKENVLAAKTLGVDPEASVEEINRKFRRLSLQYHPDKYNPAKHEDSDGNITTTKEDFEKIFKKISDARDTMFEYREKLAEGGDNDDDDDDDDRSASS